jgi:hypothetical protein
MVTSDLNVTYSIIWSLALANILGAGLCILLASPISRLTTVPFPLLAPFMISIICFAAFQATRDLADLVALLAVGLLGIYMRRFGWPRPALLIGYVLAPQAETYLYQAVQFYGWNFALRPGVLIIAALIALSIWFGVRNRVDDSATITVQPKDRALLQGRAALAERGPQVAFAALCLAAFGVALWDALQQSFLGAVFPAAMASVTGFFALMLLGVLILGSNTNPAIYDHEVEGEHVGDKDSGKLLHGALWIVLLVVLTALIGFYLAMIAFFLAFLTFRAKSGPLKTLVLTGAAAAFILVLANALSLNFPGGWLQSAVDLPWPIR